jgi:hypothetical protein
VRRRLAQVLAVADRTPDLELLQTYEPIVRYTAGELFGGVPRSLEK